jgi:HPt (histidine-containing phosphotransfer) domain-containing protein
LSLKRLFDGDAMPPYRFIDPLVLLAAVSGDPGAFRQLSEVFLSIGPAAYERLRAALERRDMKEIAQASHALKGSTMLVGAVQLTALLQQIESAARSTALEAFDQHLQELNRQFEGVMAEVSASKADPMAAEYEA